MDPLRLRIPVGWKANQFEFHIGFWSRLRTLLTGVVIVEEGSSR